MKDLMKFILAVLGIIDIIAGVLQDPVVVWLIVVGVFLLLLAGLWNFIFDEDLF